MLPATSTGVPAGRAAQVGFTLIEALVAAFILAIGVLGVVSLLTMAKVSQHEGMDRVRAVALADDMVERVRRNPGAMAVYDVGLNAPIGGGTVSTEPTPDCNSAACDATELATHDLWAWEQLLDGRATTYDDGGTATAAVATAAAMKSSRIISTLYVYRDGPRRPPVFAEPNRCGTSTSRISLSIPFCATRC